MTNYERILVTEDNIDKIKAEIAAMDQAAKIRVGETISTYGFLYSPGNQRGQITLYHNHGRGAICFGGDSVWGDIIEDEHHILLATDDGLTYNVLGEEVALQ